MTSVNDKLTPEQRQAMTALEKSLHRMHAEGFGADGIAHVLEQTFRGLWNELVGCNPPGGRVTWRRTEDPFYAGPNPIEPFRVVEAPKK